MSVSPAQDQTWSPILRVSDHAKNLNTARCFGSWRLGALALAAASLTFLTPSLSAAQESSGKLELRTTAFQPGGNIPKLFTCDGADTSPALSWSDPPPRTQSFVLIMDDPDAPGGTFVHWVVYNLPASTRQLPERLPGNDGMQGGGNQGVNDFARTGYGGPCPPPGRPHRYFFRLYALDGKLNLKTAARRKDVDQAMKGHVLAHAELMGLYGR
ncbi:MAG: YbhB/YbcL family Raf kinase inhibitor-like protein [Terriglobia bacterium]|jgi:Raf kinase inhibitor-like YbhB/YbcL family protein